MRAENANVHYTRHLLYISLRPPNRFFFYMCCQAPRGLFRRLQESLLTDPNSFSVGDLPRRLPFRLILAVASFNAPADLVHDNLILWLNVEEPQRHYVTFVHGCEYSESESHCGAVGRIGIADIANGRDIAGSQSDSHKILISNMINER